MHNLREKNFEKRQVRDRPTLKLFVYSPKVYTVTIYLSGFAGENCEYEFDECQSSPCLNGGTCMDQIGGYQCICGRGYNGKRCHIKVIIMPQVPLFDGPSQG